jgi:hypothetical protein
MATARRSLRVGRASSFSAMNHLGRPDRRHRELLGGLGTGRGGRRGRATSSRLRRRRSVPPVGGFDDDLGVRARLRHRRRDGHRLIGDPSGREPLARRANPHDHGPAATTVDTDVCRSIGASSSSSEVGCENPESGSTRFLTGSGGPAPSSHQFGAPTTGRSNPSSRALASTSQMQRRVRPAGAGLDPRQPDQRDQHEDKDETREGIHRDARRASREALCHRHEEQHHRE